MSEEVIESKPLSAAELIQETIEALDDASYAARKAIPMLIGVGKGELSVAKGAIDKARKKTKAVREWLHQQGVAPKI